MNPFISLMIASIALLFVASAVNGRTSPGVALFTFCIAIAEAGILVQGWVP